MKRVILLVFALLLTVSAFFSGCSTDSGTPPPAATVPATPPTTLPVTMPLSTPARTPVPTSLPAPVTTPEQIRPLPAERQVILVLTKDRPTSEIHLLYQGGPGDPFATRVVMRVHSSGTVSTDYIMSNGRKPLLNDEIVAPGTRGGDWCEVYVVSAGTRYKVMNETVYGGMYY
jgi:hypothetical protein